MVASGKVPVLGLSLKQDSGTAKDGAAGGQVEVPVRNHLLRHLFSRYCVPSLHIRQDGEGGLERDSVSLLSLPMTPLVLAGEKSGFRCPGLCLFWVSGKPEVAEFESG